MLKILGKTIKYLILAVVALLVLLCAVAYGLYATADMGEPDVAVDTEHRSVTDQNGIRRCGNSTLRRNPAGLWELTTGGDALSRGTESGMLLKDLLYYQEKVFVEQIRRIIPSEGYLRFLRALILIFNRDMASCIPLEYRTEIHAMAQSCSHEFDRFGTPYERQLNYHAAHDIGHTMQEYMLVGCSSFAVWDGASADSTLLAGRNFDFYVGDDFARNKLVTFCRPAEGYSFASVGWPGMVGVLSGMNTEGLTVTINAAKGSIPTHSATPISLLARTILQYAGTIEQAVAIADTTHTFVSESLLVTSAADHSAAIIEKTPRRMALFRADGSVLRCTNHYQSEEFASDKSNIENIETTDSYYRFERLGELIDSLRPLNPRSAVEILRNRYGLGGTDIGLTNEKSINQAIAHHSVVFAPEKQLMWVSTEPWQAGPYVCYDLRRIFASDTLQRLDLPQLLLPADERFLREDAPRIRQYRADVRQIRQAIDDRQPTADSIPDRLLRENPRYFGAWELCGDYLAAFGDRAEARRCWRQALQLEIPRQNERLTIERKLSKQ